MALAPPVFFVVILASRTFSFIPPCDQQDTSELWIRECHSCYGHCGKSWDGYSSDRCSCDYLCYFYHNCCPDFKEKCPAEVRKQERWKTLLEFGLPDPPLCLELKMKDKTFVQKLYFVSTCKGNKHVCERTSEDPNSFVPISDNETGLNYINLKCASCNGVRLPNIAPWRVSCKCLKEKLLTENRRFSNEKDKTALLQEVLRSKSLSTSKCHLAFDPPDSAKQLRSCYSVISPIVSSCPETCKNTELTKKCMEPIAAYVRLGWGRHFKNQYCAYCNENSRLYRLECGLSQVDASRFSPGESISFQLLFDFNPTHGLKLGKFTSMRPSCPAGHHWVHYQCRKKLQQIYDRGNIGLSPAPFCSEFHHLQKRFEDIIRNVTNHETTVSLKRCTGSYLSMNVRPSRNNARRPQDIRNSHQLILGLVNATLQEHGTIKNFDLTVDVTTCTYTRFNISDVFISDNGTLLLNNTGEVITEFRFVNDSIFVCLTTDDPPERLILTPLNYLTWGLILLSLAALCVRILCHFCLKEFQSPVGRVQTSLAVAILLALLSFLVSSFMPLKKSIFTYPSCYVAGVFMHWAFLAMFAWMSVISIDIMRMLWKSSKCSRQCYGKKVFLYLSLFAWLTPTVVVTISVVGNYTVPDERFRPEYGESLCWFNQRYALAVFFVFPVSLAILINIIMFMISVILLCKARSHKRVVEQRDSYSVTLYLKLFVLMGLTWGLGLLAGIVRSVVVDYIYVILNASQGFMFAIGSLCTTHIRKSVGERFNQSDTITPSAGRTGNMSLNTVGRE